MADAETVAFVYFTALDMTGPALNLGKGSTNDNNVHNPRQSGI
jgi:hypothetical protein